MRSSNEIWNDLSEIKRSPEFTFNKSFKLWFELFMWNKRAIMFWVLLSLIFQILAHTGVLQLGFNERV